MARTAAYKGREVTWDELMKSKEVWDPKIDLNKLAHTLVHAKWGERARQALASNESPGDFAELRAAISEGQCNAACARLGAHGTCWFTGSIRLPTQLRRTARRPSLKKGVLLDMLPEKISYAERFKLARDVGFDVVQAPTEADDQQSGRNQESRG